MIADPDDLLAGLDDAQREAVTTPALPLCVLAGAGSGKTRVLTRRIAWRCATGADDARRVLALTFTRAAASELSARLRALGLREGVRAGTFHALAWAELRAHAVESGRPTPALLDRPARLLEEIGGVGRRDVASVVAELSWARARCVPLARYPAEAALAGRSTSIDPARIVELGAEYERVKRKRGVVDFDDLLEQLAGVMANDRGFAAAQRWRFAQLYVDEFQDLNPLQHRLLEEWRGGRPALTAVGDPNQSIYAWNGSDPAFVEQFTELYPDGTIVAVDRNFRSTTPILEAANAVLDAGGLGGVRLRSVRGDGPVPEVLGFADDEQEAVAVARAIHDAKLPGRSWGQQAVLARTNRLLEPVEAALGAVGVPVRVRGRVPFHEQPVVRAALREIATAGAGFAETIAAIATRVPDGADILPGDEGADDEAIARLVELADRFTREHRAGDATTFRSWLVNEVDDIGEGDGVDLATFHGAKGREWPIVHIFGVEDGYVPIARARTDSAQAEERRLFYVACTRAESRLRISWSITRRFGDGQPVERRPSPFLTELAPTLARLRREETPARPASMPAVVRDSSGRAAGGDPRLDALREWRARRARAAGVAPNSLLPDAVLTQLLQVTPTDADELAAVPGARHLVLAGFTEELLRTLEGSPR